MKHKILGLLAALGLATAAPAQSAIIYTLESFVNDTAFVLTVPELISANTAFDLSAFDSITAPTDTLNVRIWTPPQFASAPIFRRRGTTAHVYPASM